MKRSAAITLIAQNLSEEFEENGFVDDAYYYVADSLLHKLENVGMLPPLTELKNLNGVKDNAWDPE